MLPEGFWFKILAVGIQLLIVILALGIFVPMLFNAGNMMLNLVSIGLILVGIVWIIIMVRRGYYLIKNAVEENEE